MSFRPSKRLVSVNVVATDTRCGDVCLNMERRAVDGAPFCGLFREFLKMEPKGLARRLQICREQEGV